MRMSMGDLRALLTGLGHADVSTYLQSGNALFGTDRTDTGALAAELEQAITRELDMSVRCVVRDRADLGRVVADNPLAGVATDPARLLVSFANVKPDPAVLSGIDPEAYLPEQFALGEREIYTWFPEGVRDAKLTNTFFEKKLGGKKADIVCTARNWNTVTRLLELLS
jgi:uncharacterized protein (DUF1697 family)